MFKKLLLFLALLLLAVAIVGCGSNSEEETNIEDKKNTEDAAAIVNDEVITVTELDIQVQNQLARFEQQGMDMSEEDDDIMDTLQEDILDSLITQKLVNQAAASYSVTEDEIDEQITIIKSDFETEEEYNQALAANDLTHEVLVERIEENLKLEKFFQDNIAEVNVTEEELEAMFVKYSEQSEEELNYEELKPMLEKTVVAEKQEQEKGTLIKELKEQANIEILI